MTPEQARRAALEALARVRLGEDPQAEKIRERASSTVGGLIEAFLKEHGSKLKAKTRVHYVRLLAKLASAHDPDDRLVRFVEGVEPGAVPF
jgi:hypothetical protein